MNVEEIKNWNPDRLYRINYSDIAGFVPGHNAQGEPILMGVLDTELLVALFFSPEGRYSRYALRPVPMKIDPSLLPGQQLGRHAYALQDAKREWMEELGMTPGDIHVRHFAFPEWHIGIAEWPSHVFPIVQEAIATGKP